MNSLERAVWAAEFVRERHLRLTHCTEVHPHEWYTQRAIEVADEAVLSLRSDRARFDDGSEDGCFHAVEELEMERRAELDLLPEPDVDEEAVTTVSSANDSD